MGQVAERLMERGLRYGLRGRIPARPLRVSRPPSRSAQFPASPTPAMAPDRWGAVRGNTYPR